MAVTKNLPVPYHAADTPTGDGPAAVQMILEAIGLAPVPTQAAIAAVIQAHNSEPASWYSDPDGVEGALVQLKPAAFGNTFFDYSYATEDQASRHLTYTLHHYQVAPATLVYSGGHWVVVKGIQTDQDPLQNPSYSIEGFWIHNPWPDDPLPGAVTQDVWIDYATWVSTYHTPVVYGAAWLNQFVSVCDPTVGAIGTLKPGKRRARTAGREVIPPEQALQLLRLEMATLGFDVDARLAGRGEAAQPLLVQRLDQPDGLSYVIAWHHPEGARALFHLDALYGVVREVAFLDRARRWPLFSRLDVLRRIARGELDVIVSGDRGPAAAAKTQTLRLRRGTWCLQDALVWAPCWESRSPAFPFYSLSVADRHYYISTLDGRVYDRLHFFSSPGGSMRGGV